MNIVHPKAMGITTESRLLFFEAAPERKTTQQEQPITPSEGKNLYQNRFLHVEVEDAKKILEGKYAQNPSPETAEKLASYERLFDEQFKRFNQGDQQAALGEMRKLSEEIWDSLTRSPRMRLLTRVNRFDDAKTQKEIQETLKNREWLRNAPETQHVETMYRLLGAREAGDDTIVAKVDEFLAHSDYVDWLRAALGPREKDELRATLMWHSENRPQLSDDAKKKLQKLADSVY